MGVASVSGVEMLPLIVGRPEGTEVPVPSTLHEPARPPGSDAPAPAPDTRSPAPAREVAVVPPGYVPRESDFVLLDPSRTIEIEDEPRPIRPDVEPPEDDPARP